MAKEKREVTFNVDLNDGIKYLERRLSSAKKIFDSMLSNYDASSEFEGLLMMCLEDMSVTRLFLQFFKGMPDFILSSINAESVFEFSVPDVDSIREEETEDE